MSELELLLVNQARKANPDLHRRTDGEILQMFKDNQMPDGQTDDSMQIDQLNLSNNTPQYRIRDQLTRDFLEGGIFKDAYKGLGETKDAFLEDISGLTEGIGSIKDRGIDFASYMKDKGIDLGKMVARGIGNAIMPGLGFVIGALPKDSPRNIFNRSFTVGGANMPNDNYGYYNQLRHGNLNQDPFGRNPVSMFGNYSQTLLNDVNYMGDNKRRQDKADFAKDYFNQKAAQYAPQEDININVIPQSVGGDGGNNNAGLGKGNSPTGSDTGYGTPFNRGGIASLWPR